MIKKFSTLIVLILSVQASADEKQITEAAIDVFAAAVKLASDDNYEQDLSDMEKEYMQVDCHDFSCTVNRGADTIYSLEARIVNASDALVTIKCNGHCSVTGGQGVVRITDSSDNQGIPIECNGCAIGFPHDKPNIIELAYPNEGGSWDDLKSFFTGVGSSIAAALLMRRLGM